MINLPPKYKDEPDETIKWFRNLFQYQMDEDGWKITYNYIGYRILPILYGSNYNYYYKISHGQAFILANQYGWILNANGCILDFDINKITKNIHILTGSELGLL